MAEQYDEPVSDEQVSDEPVSDEPVSDEPVSDEPVSDESEPDSAPEDDHDDVEPVNNAGGNDGGYGGNDGGYGGGGNDAGGRELSERSKALMGVLRSMLFPQDCHAISPPALEALEALMREKRLVIEGTAQDGRIQFESGASRKSTAMLAPMDDVETELNVPDLVMSEAWVMPKIAHYALQERAKGRDAFYCYLNGEVLFWTKGKFFALGKDITMFNVKEEQICRIRQQLINLRYTFRIVDPAGEVIAVVQKKLFHKPTPFKPYYKVTRGEDPEDVLYTISGNFGGYLFTVKNTDGQVLCTIRERLTSDNLRNSKKNGYELTCQPFVDALMMNCIGIICDKIDNDGG